MARGNQREQAREKNQKKLAAKQGGGDKREGSVHDRNAGDGSALANKVAAKKAAAEAAAAAGPAQQVVKPKKKKKEAEGLDDLLGAGLAGNKKKGKK
mmetsp:Transcript_16375/g.39192  ORF Transcript_16375/g.39192 Transcript_16375/m.39192 type:complete len:97 (+) Transcript_16375:117-407(+)|eukprot:CAMPEP_0181099638 /NCGR_PEP_ID=MMETSP1071-20121207/12767_1 /TAXON_ID=35127 /ORGANISM="Thalassiosira sp., Strain NH16" /LENGTH=96 /DNA_ID=CAMNT_0023182315 /DNA_START=256 /DNA_END=546 /DNA_ORIENTATION=+